MAILLALKAVSRFGRRWLYRLLDSNSSAYVCVAGCTLLVMWWKAGVKCPSPFFQRLLRCSSRHELWTLERVHKIGDRFSMILKTRLFSGILMNALARLGRSAFFLQNFRRKNILLRLSSVLEFLLCLRGFDEVFRLADTDDSQQMGIFFPRHNRL